MAGDSLYDIAAQLEESALRIRMVARDLSDAPELLDAAAHLDGQVVALRSLAAQLQEIEANPDLSPEARALLHSIVLTRMGDVP